MPPIPIKFEDSGSDTQRARILLMIEAFERPYIEEKERAERAAIASRAARIDKLFEGH
jgi:hypothetical protein